MRAHKRTSRRWRRAMGKATPRCVHACVRVYAWIHVRGRTRACQYSLAHTSTYSRGRVLAPTRVRACAWMGERMQWTGIGTAGLYAYGLCSYGWQLLYSYGHAMDRQRDGWVGLDWPASRGPGVMRNGMQWVGRRTAGRRAHAGERADAWVHGRVRRED